MAENSTSPQAFAKAAPVAHPISHLSPLEPHAEVFSPAVPAMPHLVDMAAQQPQPAALTADLPTSQQQFVGWGSGGAVPLSQGQTAGGDFVPLQQQSMNWSRGPSLGQATVGGLPLQHALPQIAIPEGWKLEEGSVWLVMVAGAAHLAALEKYTRRAVLDALHAPGNHVYLSTQVVSRPPLGHLLTLDEATGMRVMELWWRQGRPPLTRELLYTVGFRTIAGAAVLS